MALGIIENKFDYEEHSIKLTSGDILILYTDGVTEAMNPGHQLYGDEQLFNLLSPLSQTSPEAILNTIVESVKSFSGSHEQSDDITLLALRFHHVLEKSENSASITLSQAK
jgi:sigma-B regulation protein RsbU (phosphoserine phosphatase)